MKLYVIRHGETKWNTEKRMQGQSDVELNEKGISLARVTAKALEEIPFQAIYSSPLKRAYVTAEIIKGSRTVEIIKDDRLKEMCFGDYEGKRECDLPPEFHYIFDDPEKYVPVGVGESFEQVIDRTKDFLEKVIIPQSDTLDYVAIVAHGALNNGLACTLLHREIKDYWAGVFPKNCSVSIYEINGHEFNCLEYGKIFY